MMNDNAFSVNDVEEQMTERVPPHSLEIEQQVLGAMMLNAQAIMKASIILDRQCFYRGRHREIYDAMLRLYNRGEPVDLTMLSEELEGKGVLQECGGIAYLADIGASVGTSSNVEYHARVLAEKAIRRRVIVRSDKLREDCYDPSVDIHEAIEGVETDLAQIRTTDGRGKVVELLGDIMVAEVEAARRGETKGHVIPTGFPQPSDGGVTPFDAALGGGLHTEELYVIGARPAQGKTSLGVQMAYTAAMADSRTSVGYINLEGGRRAIASVATAQLAKVDPRALVSPVERKKTNEQQWDEMEDWAKWMQSLPVHVDDMAYERPATAEKLRSHARMLRMEHGVNFLIIDYLTKIHYDRRNYQEDLGRVLDELSDIAVSENMAVLLFHHLNREYDEEVRRVGEPVRPSMGHFGLTGALDRYAFGIFALCNPHGGLVKPKSLIQTKDNGTELADPIDWGHEADAPKRVELTNIKIKDGSNLWSIPFEWVGRHRLFKRFPQVGGAYGYVRNTAEPKRDDDERPF